MSMLTMFNQTELASGEEPQVAVWNTKNKSPINIPIPIYDYSVYLWPKSVAQTEEFVVSLAFS